MSRYRPVRAKLNGGAFAKRRRCEIVFRGHLRIAGRGVVVHVFQCKRYGMRGTTWGSRPRFLPNCRFGPHFKKASLCKVKFPEMHLTLHPRSCAHWSGSLRGLCVPTLKRNAVGDIPYASENTRQKNFGSLNPVWQATSEMISAGSASGSRAFCKRIDRTNKVSECPVGAVTLR